MLASDIFRQANGFRRGAELSLAAIHHLGEKCITVLAKGGAAQEMLRHELVH
jgi:hypothetical protein